MSKSTSNKSKEMDNWNDIKASIKSDLNNRNLSDPSIRIRAISSIDKLLYQYIEDVKTNPIALINELEKSDLKRILSRYKDNEKLNGAEESIVNEIYYRTDI